MLSPFHRENSSSQKAMGHSKSPDTLGSSQDWEDSDRRNQTTKNNYCCPKVHNELMLTATSVVFGYKSQNRVK